MENQMVRAITSGNCFRKYGWWFKGDAIFLLVLVCSEYLDILCSWSISCHVKLLDSFIFLLKISTQVVCVNELCKHPYILLRTCSWSWLTVKIFKKFVFILLFLLLAKTDWVTKLLLSSTYQMNVMNLYRPIVLSG